MAPFSSLTPPSPKSVYTRKRKFMVHEEEKEEKDIPAPIPLSATPFIQTSPKPFVPPPSTKINPLAVTFPLELLAVQDEMTQFYTEDDPSKRTFPSLHGFETPKNIYEYLKLKGKQAEDKAKEECKGLGDINLSARMQHWLGEVKKLEDFARDLSKNMSNLSPNAELQKTLRNDFLNIIMDTKPYEAYRSDFKDWPLEALNEEVNRIEKMNKDPQMQKSAPNWKQYKKVEVDEVLKYKRMRAELVAAKFGTARQIGKWCRQYIDRAYNKLEERRKTDPSLPKKPVYKDETTVIRRQTVTSKKLFSSADVSIAALNQRKRQQLMDEEDENRYAEYRKESIRNQLRYGLDDASLQLQAQVAQTLQKLASRPQSPNSSQIKLLPRNPSDPKILKWKSDKQTHELTLIKSDGSVEKISRENALGLNPVDLQDLFNLQLDRDEDDTDSLDFELQFKGQIRERLMRE